MMLYHCVCSGEVSLKCIRRLAHRCAMKVTMKLREESTDIPITKLERKNFDNLRYALDRQELLSLMPKLGICAEIGVAQGDFTQDIIAINNPGVLHLVDSWGSKRYGEKMMHNVMSRFSTQIETGNVRINRGISTEILSTFEDGYFDWVYIDTVHDYEITRSELEICKDKVKPGGIIAGHDYCMGNWKKGLKYGVIEAVYNFCVENDWEILYITSEIKNPSFALRRL